MECAGETNIRDERRTVTKTEGWRWIEKEGWSMKGRGFGERTPLTRDWKVTRSCDCVWMAKFEGKEAKDGVISSWRAPP